MALSISLRLFRKKWKNRPTMKIMALDTEGTGLDPFHGSRPYYVNMSDADGNILYWRGRVDPLTRKVIFLQRDLEDMKREIESCDILVFQNSKYDMRVLDFLFKDYGMSPIQWDWSKIRDLGISAHMLGSCQPKDLTTLALVYAGYNIEPFEIEVVKAADKARRICRTKAFKESHGNWAIAHEDRKDMPSGAGVKSDMWVPYEICMHAPDYLPDWKDWVVGDPVEDHPWMTVMEEYANPDPHVTALVYEEHMRLLENKELIKIYNKRLEMLPLVYKIEEKGVTVSVKRTEELIEKFSEITETNQKRCLTFSEGKLDKLPVAGRSNKLNDFVFNDLGLESPKKTDNGAPSMDKDVIAYWLSTLRPQSKAFKFIQSLKSYRKFMTAVTYMKSYNRYGLSCGLGFLLLHPSLNMVGTNTLRWSSSNPNEQNISKQEETNLRYTFGPRPGRLWASLDYENLELRLPAYEAGERLLTDLFERPNDAPFYGSNHLLNFSTIYPELWDPLLAEYGPEHVGDAVKKKYKSTFYQRCKNGWFAIQYGAVEIEGKVSTADRSFGKIGAHSMLKQKLGMLEQLNQKWIAIAKKTGFVETIPDRMVDPERGYPIQCSRNKWGRVSPTIPLNYHIQGTACWVIGIAMLMVEEYLKELNRMLPSKDHWFITMQIHDELVIDLPKKGNYIKHLLVIQEIMASVGVRINIPLKVGCDVHDTHWAKGTPLCELTK